MNNKPVPLHRKGNTVVIVGGGVLPRTAPYASWPHHPRISRVAVRLYDTVVAQLDEGKLTLDTGGFGTVTTRQRMNQFLQDYAHNMFSVCVRKGQHYLVPRGHTAGIPFDRRITVDIT